MDFQEPSGFALAIETDAGWRLACVESSYERFQRGSAGDLGAITPQTDKLDAVACAWDGIGVLAVSAKSYGDVDSAIWVPMSEQT